VYPDQKSSQENQHGHGYRRHGAAVLYTCPSTPEDTDRHGSGTQRRLVFLDPNARWPRHVLCSNPKGLPVPGLSSYLAQNLVCLSNLDPAGLPITQINDGDSKAFNRHVAGDICGYSLFSDQTAESLPTMEGPFPCSQLMSANLARRVVNRRIGKWPSCRYKFTDNLCLVEHSPYRLSKLDLHRLTAGVGLAKRAIIDVVDSLVRPFCVKAQGLITLGTDLS
jgi:hypothetical protein